MKFSIGTAQLGSNYGIANTSGQVSLDEATRILDFANKSGVEMLDTASAYGSSECILGSIPASKLFKITTKLPANYIDNLDVSTWGQKSVKNSLQLLRADSIYGLLIHRPEQLFGVGGKDLLNFISKLKFEGVIKKIGVSAYDPEQIEQVLKIFTPDIIQAPINLFDRRLIDGGLLDKLSGFGVEVHARSIFLQGLLLLPRDAIPDKFKKWNYLFDRWHNWLDENSISPVRAALSLASDPRIDRVIVGIDRLEQLELIMSEAKKIDKFDCPNLSSSDLQLINPSNWKNL